MPPLKKPKKDHTQAWYHKKATELAKVIAKERDHMTCQKCGNKGKDGYQIHGSHILSVGAHATLSADPYNIKALCANCHSPNRRGSWHDDPAPNIEWFKNKFPGRLEELYKRDRELLGKQNWKEVYMALKFSGYIN